MSLATYLQRAAAPRIVAAASEVRWPGKAAAAATRARGGRGRVELYIAFDDPYSALAIVQLSELLATRSADLVLYPMVRRGLPDDPSDDLRRRFALADSARLARRIGLTLSRDEPIDPAATAFLAKTAESLRGSSQMELFTTAALRRLWFETAGELTADAFADLSPSVLLGDPAATGRLAANTARMRAKGQWDAPAARVHGEWFFAHERIAQITERLDYLGWT